LYLQKYKKKVQKSGAMKKSYRIIFYIMLSGFLAVIFSACTKSEDVIENVLVDIYLDTSLPSNNNLTVIGGWIYVNGGSKGIVVFRRSNDEYVAFDRNCTYQPANKCAVKVESSNLIVTDACCGSRFQLTDGIVIKGPATRGLKQYNAIADKNGVVHVYN
jgi:nitrite reductase/ring-hydroxylating ferredoxin subunit